MDNTRSLLVATILVAFATSLQQKEINVRLERSQSRSQGFIFEYKLDNGEVFRGELIHVHKWVYFIFGANDTVYGVTLTNEEINSNSSFCTLAEPVQRLGDRAVYCDFFDIYEIFIPQNWIRRTHDPKWLRSDEACILKESIVNDTIIDEFKYLAEKGNQSQKYEAEEHDGGELNDGFIITDGVGLLDIRFEQNDYLPPFYVTQNVNPRILKSLIG